MTSTRTEKGPARLSRTIERNVRRAARYLRYLVSPRSVLPAPPPSGVLLTPGELRRALEPRWYHDFQPLGFPTRQRGRIYRPNQQCKQAPLFRMIERAIVMCREQGENASGVELFCADGLYSNYAMAAGADRMLGIDRDGESLKRARLMARILGHPTLDFRQGDALALTDTYDFGICAGGLYHLTNPKELLVLLRSLSLRVLVLQTVISLADTGPDYFEAPAPGRATGCRFSLSFLLRMVRESGWLVISQHTNELLGNENLQNRGSAYLLCIPTERAEDQLSRASRVPDHTSRATAAEHSGGG